MGSTVTARVSNPLLLRQLGHLKALGLGGCCWKRGQLVWTGELTPSPVCETYLVRVSWDGSRRRPRVKVLRPQLRRRAGEKLPHVFGDGSLCLHFNGEWLSTMPISESIIPWASEWLYFYELWLATGDWLGGGHEPGPEDPDKAGQGIGGGWSFARVAQHGQP